jgi:hypothetical protein
MGSTPVRVTAGKRQHIKLRSFKGIIQEGKGRI